jgi:carboxylesterase
VCAGCRIITNRLVTREDERAPRNPETGILLGAESRDLGAEDAGRAVLMVHGFIGAGNNFNDLPDRIAAEGWRVRIMRLPGHGTSPRDFEKVTEDDLYRAVREEFEALQAKYPHVVLLGHSMGGALCTLLAAEADVDGLVLGAPYFKVTHKWFYILPPEAWTTMTSPFMRWARKGKTFMQVNRKEVKDQIVAYRWTPMRGTKTLMKVGRNARNPELLGNVTCPVLLIHSPLDIAASPKAAAQAFDALGSADKRAVWLETSNHIIFWDYEREQVAEEIVAFLGSLDTG